MIIPISYVINLFQTATTTTGIKKKNKKKQSINVGLLHGPHSKPRKFYVYYLIKTQINFIKIKLRFPSLVEKLN